ncbi:hypothetical protein GCM10023170_053140 [Phytohabitans houttuyneae]|uniref:Haloacid dehalogenase n=1 Tax=Phytohabitans houttuyneae TaxID=1076126 RepID=A0A6V8K585_9ACTN|nr:hypothetical protein Phou_045430 [Phytohabitans houttuyneae]
MTTPRRSIQVLILDMDDTLYRWVDFFAPALGAMVAKAAELLGVDEDRIREDLKIVHRRRGNTEQPFALLETDIVQERLPTKPQVERHEFLRPAFAEFNRIRSERLRLFSDVVPTLTSIKASGCRIFGHTEATDVNIRSRIRTLGLQSMLEAVYAPSFSGPPHPLGDAPHTPLSVVEIREVPSHKRKPDPDVVLGIAREVGVPPHRCLYVGDNLKKDITMAKHAGMLAAWARYGAERDPDLWEQVVRVTHWDPTDAAQAADVHLDVASPDVILDAFGELLLHFEFAGVDDTSGYG